MAAIVAGKTLLAIIQAWMERFDWHFNHMCAGRQHTLENCVLYALLGTFESLLKSVGQSWALLGSFGPVWALLGPFCYEEPFWKVFSIFYITLVGGVRKLLFISVRHSWTLLGPFAILSHVGPFLASFGPFLGYFVMQSPFEKFQHFYIHISGRGQEITVHLC